MLAAITLRGAQGRAKSELGLGTQERLRKFCEKEMGREF